MSFVARLRSAAISKCAASVASSSLLTTPAATVYAKRPFRRAEHLLGYLGRYTHRVAIANSRLVDVESDAVTFRTQNGKTEMLHPVAFLHRFKQHVLPDGFKKIRHFGLYAGSQRNLLEAARCQLSKAVPSCTPPPSWAEQFRL